MKKPRFSIGIPTYNGSAWIGETLKSIFSQEFKDYEIIIVDDNSKDETYKVIKLFKNKQMKIYRNEKNLGSGPTIERLHQLASGEILYFMGQDDILLPHALFKTHKAFLMGADIGLVTRPYYWFDEVVDKPLRTINPYDPSQDKILSVFDGKRTVQKIFESVGQFSGLGYRMKYIDIPFHRETFTTHIYPFASIAKKYKVVYLKDYTVAVRISSSQTRLKSSIYDEISPTKSWVNMFDKVYRGKKYLKVREAGIEQIVTHFIGLVQIKNYSTIKNLLREILILIAIRPLNLLNLRFWLISLGTLIIPRQALIFFVDKYKKTILGPRILWLKR